MRHDTVAARKGVIDFALDSSDDIYRDESGSDIVAATAWALYAASAGQAGRRVTLRSAPARHYARRHQWRCGVQPATPSARIARLHAHRSR
jgi:hypothetical protein